MRYYINVFAVVVKEKEREGGFIELSRVHHCLQFLPLTNVSDLIYIQVLLWHFMPVSTFSASQLELVRKTSTNLAWGKNKPSQPYFTIFTCFLIKRFSLKFFLQIVSLQGFLLSFPFVIPLKSPLTKQGYWFWTFIWTNCAGLFVLKIYVLKFKYEFSDKE